MKKSNKEIQTLKALTKELARLTKLVNKLTPKKGKIIARPQTRFKASSAVNAAKRGVSNTIPLPKRRNAGKGPKSAQIRASKPAGIPVSAKPAKPAPKPAPKRMKPAEVVNKKPLSPFRDAAGRWKRPKSWKEVKKDMEKAKKTPPNPEFMWYVVSVQQGYRDRKVRTAIVRGKKQAGLTRLIKKVVLVKYESPEVREGVVKIIRRLAFPGYILVHCKLTEDVQSYLQNMRGVFTLLMNPEKIVAMQTQQAAEIMLRNQDVLDRQKKERLERKAPADSKFKVGMEVVVIRKNPGIDPWHLVSAKVSKVNGSKVTIQFQLIGTDYELILDADEVVPRALVAAPANGDEE